MKAIKKPTPVTVFGVLNIVIATWRLAVILPMLFKRIANNQVIEIFKESAGFFLLSVLTAGLFIWLLVLGIGLLTMKRWARRGSCMCAWAHILLTAVLMGIFVLSLTLYHTGTSYHDFFMTCTAHLDRLIYPVMLLIFMQTEDVKKTFAPIER
jgi:hypothetical protein